jgi:uncharacterized membrane protein YphA (DoxX/SURF4 family)
MMKMEAPTRYSEPRTALFWIALLRIMMGLLFLTTWGNNLREGLYTPDGLVRFFSEVFPQNENPLGWYAAFIEGVILPVRAVFAPFQLVTELLMGVGLLVGAFTPFFSLAGIFFLINTMLASAGQDWPWAYLMPIGILIIVFLTRAGRSFGLDARLLRRFGERGPFLW